MNKNHLALSFIILALLILSKGANGATLNELFKILGKNFIQKL